MPFVVARTAPLWEPGIEDLRPFPDRETAAAQPRAWGGQPPPGSPGGSPSPPSAPARRTPEAGLAQVRTTGTYVDLQTGCAVGGTAAQFALVEHEAGRRSV